MTPTSLTIGTVNLEHLPRASPLQMTRLPGSFFKLPMPGPHYGPIKSGSLEVRHRHWWVFNALQVILTGIQGWKPTAQTVRLKSWKYAWNPFFEPLFKKIK